MSSELTPEARFAAALAAHATTPYELQLFVAGVSALSRQTISALTDLCEQFLPGRYTLQVVDIYQQPERAAAAGIVAVPTLIRVLPQPTVRLIGDLTNSARVLHGLDIALERGGEHG